jgi:Fe-S cluster assembly protein SufD
MSELLDFYQQQAAGQVSTIPWLLSMQKKAISDFTRMGFPSRRDEDWKYTSMDSFLKHRFLGAKASAGQAIDKASLPLTTGLVVQIINGVAVGLEALAASLPDGVVVQSLSEALVQHPEKIKPYLSQIVKQQHGFQALNTAMMNCGLFIFLPKGVALTTPLILSHSQDKAEQAIYSRHLVVAEEGSSATVIEEYHGELATRYFTNTLTEVCLAAHAVVTHFKIQRESQCAYHIGHLAVRQAAGSRFNSHSFSMGGALVRSDITIALQEPKSTCLMNGIYAPGEGQHIDHHTTVMHEAPDCQSEQDYKGILTGRSRAVFNGQIIVAKDAQHTLAKQQNKNLLLSANSEIDTKPQLNIMADDVVCTHGATVGQLDEDALFYLAARGIDRAQAKRYLVQAFATENLQRLENAELQEWLGELLNQQLG